MCFPKLAFDKAEEVANIPQMLDVKDMVEVADGL